MEKEPIQPPKDQKKQEFTFKNKQPAAIIFVILLTVLAFSKIDKQIEISKTEFHTRSAIEIPSNFDPSEEIKDPEVIKTELSETRNNVEDKEQKKKKIAETIAKSPIGFTKNMGQWDNNILYKGDVLGLNISYLKNGLSFGFRRNTNARHEQLVWNQVFEGMNSNAEIIGESKTDKNVNYIKGTTNGNTNTFANTPNFSELNYINVYNNIDVKYYGSPSSPNQLETDFILRSGANINDIRVKFDGIKNLSIDKKGVLQVNNVWGTLKEYIPSSYQLIEGEKKEVSVKYKLIDQQTYGFEICGIYDRSKELIIDPVILQWATFVGGVQPVPHYIYGSIIDIECDSLGNTYGTGWNSDGFPTTPGTYQVANAGQSDVIVFKMNPPATVLLWATYIGTTNGGAASQQFGDIGRGIDFDATGIYVTGGTDRNTFPTTAGSYQSTFTGTLETAFALKLNPTGTTLLYSTFLGNNSRGESIDVLSTGEVILGGYTGSGFPVTGGAAQPVNAGGIDGFVTKLNATGSALVYSTHIGGSANDTVFKITTDKAGNTYACGSTASPNFPTVGPFQAAISGPCDAFLLKLNTTGTALSYSTYFGGSAFDCGYGVAVNSAGQAYICGGTKSANLPTLAPFQANIKVGSPFDAYVTKFNAAGSGLIYSTYLGGTDNDIAWDIDVSCTDQAYVNGWTSYGVNGSPKTTGFPTTTCGFVELPSWGGNVMVGSYPPSSFFISKFSSAGALLYSSAKIGCSKQTALALVEYNCCVRGVVSGSGVWHQISQLEFITTKGVFQETDPRWTKVDIAVLYRITPKAGMTLTQTSTTCASAPKFTITFADACWGTPSLSWDFGDGTSGTGTSVTHQFPGPGTYNVKVTSDCPFDTLKKSVVINAPPCTPIPAVTGSSVCSGNCTSITATASGGSSPYTFSWNTGTTGSTLNACPTVNTTYTLTLTDSKGASNTSTALVSVSPGVTLTATKTDAGCANTNDGSVTASASGGATPYTYFWSTTPGQTSATISNLPSGTYTVTATDSKGCTQTTTAVVSQPPAIILNPASGSANCGSSNGNVAITGSGGTGSLSYVWNTGATGTTLTGVAAGSYTVTATDSKNCTQSAVVTISNSPSPAINSLTGTSLACPGSNSGTTTVNASGGTGTLTYNWSNGISGTTSLSTLSAGTYVVSVKDANGCIAVSSVSITEPPAIVTNASQAASTCGSANGSASVTISNGGTAPFSYSWNTGATGQTISGIVAAPYTVTVTDLNGCTKTASVTVNNIAGGVVTASTQSNIICNGANNGSVTATVSGGTPPYTYSWSNAFTGQTPTNLSPGIYTVTTTDAGGCTSIGTATVTEPPAVTVNATSTPATCGAANGSVNAGGSGGNGSLTYHWNGGAVTPAVSGLAAGSYTVTVSDVNNCSTTAVAIVGNTGSGTVTTSVQSDVSCYGGNNGSVIASITGGTPAYTYLWNTGVTTAALSGIAKGTYTVTVTDASNCQIISTVAVTEPPAIIASTGSVATTCGSANGSASVTASGGTGTLNYSWNNGVAGQTASNLASATYTVTITDANNCIATAVAAVSSDPAPSINSMNSSALLCAGNSDGSASVSVTGGTGTLTYSWSNGSTGATSITGLTAGIYGVSVTDASGCTAISTVAITEPPALNAPVFNTTNANCGISDGSATATSSGGTPTLVYSWSNGSNGAVAVNLAAGTYTVTVTDANGCAKTGVASVNNNGGPTITSITPTDVLCNGGNTGSVNIVVSNGTTPYSYNWSNGITLITSNTQSTINNLQSSTYTVTVNDANNCKITTTVTLTEPIAIITTFNVSNAACGQNNGSATATSSGGTGTLIYSWSNGANGQTADNLIAGTYTLTITDVNNCKQTESISVSNVGAPTATTAVALPILCNGGTGGVNVTVSGGTGPYAYSWSNGTGSITTNLQSDISSITAATYTVTVSDSKNCIIITTVTLVEPAALTVSATGQPSECGKNNGVVSASASGGTSGYIYNWSDGTLGQKRGGLAPSTYTVTVTDSKGCTTTSSSTVGDTTFVITSSTPAQQTITQGQFVTITVSGGVTYTWSPAAGLSCDDCPNPVATPMVTTTYTVTATDAYGCTAIAMLKINVKPPCMGDEGDVFIANIFSPNNDGKNDVLYIEGNGLTNIYWGIYDRWGNLLFEAFDQTHGWDGTKRGNYMDPGTYVYYLRATCIRTFTEVRLKGNVTIVR